jgi:hypothetical protein
MNACCFCGEVYVTRSSAWGEECGDCIAAGIEMMLTGGLPLRDRKPSRRASSELVAGQNVPEERCCAVAGQ